MTKISKIEEILTQNGICDFSGEVQLLEWSKSTSRDGPKIKFMFPDDESLRHFEMATVKKGKQAGQIYHLFAVRLDEELGEKEEIKENSTFPDWLNAAILQEDVLEKLGTDAEYLDWIRRRRSCLSGVYSEYVNGDGRSIAAHVRRAKNSGTSIKPDYSAVPLTDAEHKIQSNKGEAALLEDYFNQKTSLSLGKIWSNEEAKEWFDGALLCNLSLWAEHKLQEKIGHKPSRTHGEIEIAIINWFKQNDLSYCLPEQYQ